MISSNYPSLNFSGVFSFLYKKEWVFLVGFVFLQILGGVSFADDIDSKTTAFKSALEELDSPIKDSHTTLKKRSWGVAYAILTVVVVICAIVAMLAGEMKLLLGVFAGGAVLFATPYLVGLLLG